MARPWRCGLKELMIGSVGGLHPSTLRKRRRKETFGICCAPRFVEFAWPEVAMKSSLPLLGQIPRHQMARPYFGACPLTKSAHVDHFGSSLSGLLQVFSISYNSFFLQLTSITIDSLDVAYCITTHGPTSRVA